VAWALEGLARVLEKQGSIGKALQAYKEAGEIRNTLQAKDASMELFAKELLATQDRQRALVGKLRVGHRLRVLRGREALQRSDARSGRVVHLAAALSRRASQTAQLAPKELDP